MTSSEARQNLIKNAVNLIYCFVEQEAIDKNVFGRFTTTIREKRLDQMQYVSVMAKKAGISTQQGYDLVSQTIIDVYGMSPRNVLIALAQGKDVRGKNWKAGIFGIGETTGATTTFVPSGSSAYLSDGYKFTEGNIFHDNSRAIGASRGFPSYTQVVRRTGERTGEGSAINRIVG